MPGKSKVRSITIPPPVNGWNTKDSISEMDPTYAVEALNYFSDGATVDMRKGYTYWAKSVGTEAVSSLHELALQSGTRKLIALGNNSRLYNVSSTGAGADLSNAGAFTISGGICTACNFRNRIFFKGISNTDDVTYWDGAAASVAAAAFTGPGGDDKALFNPFVYKNRIYFVEYQAASIWYAASAAGVGAVTGALTEFDTESILTLGGKLLFGGVVTKTGNTDNEYLALISDQGEVLVYGGDNPSSSTWGIVGHYYMAPPLGERAFHYWGPNLVIMTYEGVVLLSEILSGNPDFTYLSDKINKAIKDEIADGGGASSRYWSMQWHPKSQSLIVNTYNNRQFVMSTANRSWWEWTIPALSFGLMAGDLYFGASGLLTGIVGPVMKANNGYFDQSTEAGAIASRATLLRPAYNYFGNRLINKQLTQANIIVSESEGLSLTVDADLDYKDTSPTSTLTDTTDTAYKVYRATAGLTGIGKCASIRFEQNVTTKRRSIHAIEVLWQPGDV